MTSKNSSSKKCIKCSAKKSSKKCIKCSAKYNFFIITKPGTYIYKWVKSSNSTKFARSSLNKTDVGRPKTLGHLRSLNPNMINHFANQSQTSQLLKILKTNFFFKTFHEKKLKSGAINLRLNWYRKSIYRLSRGSYIYIYMCVEFLASHFNDLFCCISKFTRWTIIQELSIRRRLRTFLISWGQKTRVKHCYVDLSSWHELWFAILCVVMNVILDLSTAIQ